MITSMTGFGKATLEQPSKILSVEIKTLNSKQLDISCRLPYAYRALELEIRNILSNALQRGKIDFILTIENVSSQPNARINTNNILSYCSELENISKQLGKPSDNILQLALSLPEAITYSNEELSEKEQADLKNLINVALEKVNDFRKHEGALLYTDFVKRINNINSHMLLVEEYAPKRIDAIKERIQNSLTELQAKIDENRFEQELIYYIEKLDITEELVRLKKHLDYFMEMLNSSISEGRKLGFVTQEIGREINTIGSKANNADMQKIVVNMKDELEKIKEQLGNIL